MLRKLPDAEEILKLELNVNRKVSFLYKIWLNSDLKSSDAYASFVFNGPFLLHCVLLR